VLSTTRDRMTKYLRSRGLLLEDGEDAAAEEANEHRGLRARRLV